MRAFALGALGALAVAIAAALIVPMYADYRTRAQSHAWLADLRTGTMVQIAEAAMRNGTVAGSGRGIAMPTFASAPPAHVEITDDGALILHGGRDGQLMVLTPRIDGDDVIWTCRGGSARDVPSQCAADAER